MKQSSAFRTLMKAGKIIVAPGAYDGITARLIAHAGFPAVYMTGAGTAATLGYPDFGLVTMTEMVANAATLARAVDIPVIADADTGYGNELNVTRTVREYEGPWCRRHPYRGSGGPQALRSSRRQGGGLPRRIRRQDPGGRRRAA